jgi:prepilin-type N-terminal cleavage/methylation domain-containing protein
MQKNRAFTLIELLVVIAIIAILAAIVLVSLSAAQNRAKDARLVATMNQVRTDAQTFFSSKSLYTGYTTDADYNYAKLSADATSMGRTITWVYGTDATKYCAYVQYMSSTSKYWCIDYKLTSKELSASPTTCVAATATCE